MTFLNESLPSVNHRDRIRLQYIPPCDVCTTDYPNSESFPAAVIFVDNIPVCRIHAQRKLFTS